MNKRVTKPMRLVLSELKHSARRFAIEIKDVYTEIVGDKKYLRRLYCVIAEDTTVKTIRYLGKKLDFRRFKKCFCRTKKAFLMEI